MTVHTVALNQLESHLWEAAKILRGPVDAQIQDLRLPAFVLQAPLGRA